MKIMVTGGTGFVGSHTVAELLGRGHHVTLLVRNPELINRAAIPFNIDDVNLAPGDVTNPLSVENAAQDCEATIHCASVYSLDPRAAKRINQTNITGTNIVLKTADKFAHDPIVHVSSFVALIGTKDDVLSPASTPGTPPGAYFRSKADSDRIARQYQEKGCPVVITYPGSVWGPYDPHFGESCQMAKNILRRLWPIAPRGMIPITDVRDLARLHAAILEKGRGARRYIAPATNLKINEAIALFAALTRRGLPALSVPTWTLLKPTQALDWFQRVAPFRFPINYQAVYCAGLCHILDDSLTRNEFHILPTPIINTFTDTIRWMYQHGYISPNLAGALAKIN